MDEKLRLKMFEELDNIDNIVKASSDNISLTKHEYLLHLRTVYHEKVTGLKHQKELFREQL